MHHKVALLLVSHDGARWLPTVLGGVRAQRAPIERVIAVDTGSKDGSADLLAQAFGEASVRRETGRCTFPDAVRIALEETDPEVDWVWILHDDSTPDPAALETLLIAAEEFPDAAVLGPKLREWPSLRRLLELGVTISGTGRRETGLERGEYDQGQHDEVRTVLAVNTAGMLVRRSVLDELGGLDPQLPIFGNDIDFGWRAATAGHRTIIVPQAVVFHAEAAHRGVRRTPLTGRHTHYQERRAALYTLLANGRARMLPFQTVRLAVGTLLRMIGFLLVREVGTALDELAALGSVLSRPGDVLAARRERQGRASRASGAGARALLPPWWLPYRHGLDFVGDVASAITNQYSDVAERRRIAAAEADPASFAARRQAEEKSRDEDEVPYDTGLLARFFTNPVAVLLVVVAILGVIGARAAFGHVVGGGLSPVPDGARAWWKLQLESWHPLMQGSGVPAPPYVVVLALLASLLLGHAKAAVVAVMVLAFPIALGGAWRLLRVVGRLISHRGAPRWLILWGATAWALVPAVSGAWGDGRLGEVVAGALLPWMAHAALGFADPEPDRRWRAAWRTGLLLATVTAFAPAAWLVALVLALIVLGAALRIVPHAAKDPATYGPAATALGIPVLLLLPWWLPAVLHHAAAGLLLDAGRLPAPAPDGWQLALGRLPDLGAPWWLGLVLPLMALLALIPQRTRIPVLVCWVVGLAAALVALVLGFVHLQLPAGPFPAGLAFPLVAIQGTAVIAACLGVQGALAEGLVTGWRRGIAAVLAVAALAGPVGGMVWFVVDGNESLVGSLSQGAPSYMLDTGAQTPASGVLLLRGSVADGVAYTVLRGDGTTIGEDEIITLTPSDPGFGALVQDFVSDPTPDVVKRLAGDGIEYVVQPAPVDPSISATIDSSGELTRASAATLATRAWQLVPPPSAPQLSGHRSWLHIALVVLQLGGLVVVLVMCLPTIVRPRRHEGRHEVSDD